MTVGLYTPYLETLGGGERYVLTVAEFFLRRGDSVNLFWDGNLDFSKLEERFSLHLTGLSPTPNIFNDVKTSLVQRLAVTSRYDLVFFLSDGSIPSSLAKINLLHFQTPFHYANQRTLLNRIKLARFKNVVCNSAFTKKFIDRTYGVESKILYPPVDVARFQPDKKEKIILSIGRFFGPSHPKKQEVLVRTFSHISQKLIGWKLVLVGGVTAGSWGQVDNLRRQAGRLPVEIITDVGFPGLQKWCGRAAVYWHAAGYGVDLNKEPEKAEHFGISIVEAMAAGAVPVVFAGGGPAEIVTDDVNGLTWLTTKELETKTTDLVEDLPRRQELARQARERAQFFSKERFFTALPELL